MKTVKQYYEDTMDNDWYQIQVDRGPDGIPLGSIDGGDTAHRTGHFHFLVEANKKIGNYNLELYPYDAYSTYKRQMNELESKWGCYCRYPKKEYNLEPQHYYNEGPYHGVMSRDQTQPLVLAAGAKKDYFRVLRMMATHSLRLFIATQKTKRFLSPTEGDYEWRRPDFTFFEFFALYLRAIPVLGYILYPLVLLGDLETLGGSIFRRFTEIGRKNDDVANHCSICINGMQRVPTPIMWLANKVNSYKQMKDLQEKYWHGWRQNRAFPILYDAPMKKYFGS